MPGVMHDINTCCCLPWAAHLSGPSCRCAWHTRAPVVQQRSVRSHAKQARRPFVPGSEFSRDGDFVAAYFTEPRRHKLVEAGREWRKVLP